MDNITITFTEEEVKIISNAISIAVVEYKDRANQASTKEFKQYYDKQADKAHLLNIKINKEIVNEFFSNTIKQEKVKEAVLYVLGLD